MVKIRQSKVSIYNNFGEKKMDDRLSLLGSSKKDQSDCSKKRKRRRIRKGEEGNLKSKMSGRRR